MAPARRYGGSASLGAVLALATAATAACTGTIGGEAATTSTGSSPPTGGPGSAAPDAVAPNVLTSLDGPTTFSCNPTAKPAIDQIRALTARQYLHTVADLITAFTGSVSVSQAVLSDSSVTTAATLLQPNVPTVPLPLVEATTESTTNATNLGSAFPDGGWLRADQSIEQSRVAGFYTFGAALAQVLTGPTYLAGIVGSCALGTNAGSDTACLTSFLDRVGPLILRRRFKDANHPLDLANYLAAFTLNGPDTTATNPAAAAYQDVLTALFNAPEFLYFVEDDPSDAPVPSLAGVYQLNGYELASRLSYHIWDTMPDASLLAAAADGSLLQPGVYQAQVNRLFADPRATETLEQFFIDYFQTESQGGPRGTGGLNYHYLADPNALASPQFRAFAGANLPTATLYGDMVNEATGMASYYSNHGGTLHDLLTSPASFAQAADLADIYGLPIWDGSSKPPAFGMNQRPGVFTRALFTSAGIDTSPILKGVYLRRYVLCDTIPPPPAQAAGKSVPLTTTETTRQATTALTGASPCNSCHTNWINPLGFATENFDGLGRFRTQQTLYTTTGQVATKLPIDTQVTPYVFMGDGTTTASDAEDLMTLIEDSDKPAACMARNYFRYTFARFEDLSLDGCALSTMKKTLDNGGQLADLWKSVTQTALFTQRTVQ